MNKWKIAFLVTAGLLVVNNVGAIIGMRSYEEAGRIYRGTIDDLSEQLDSYHKENNRLVEENFNLKNPS